MSLLAWLHHLLGYENTAQLLESGKEPDEGFGADGQSHVYTYLTSRESRLNGVTTADLQRYDANIGTHLAAMNAGRTEPITLRYFQYLAALYAEIYLDRYCGNRASLLRELNDFVKQQRNAGHPSKEWWTDFEESDVRKLAFWMATGGGKTLLLHLNYRQFRHYNDKYGQPLDNILLITPNEGLSQQHLDELRASNIPAVRFGPDASGRMLTGAREIKITEITKLVEEKRGGGIRVPVETFEGNNLIFVDEGHKGAGGDAWRSTRDALGATGFTFEYSATFGQALAAANNDALLTEYGKAIAFDYSYRHFYKDGYGKDFRILNLRRETTPADTDMLLLANLLSFYEQQRVFEDAGETLRPYNLERPLWVFVGSTVRKKENDADRSDMLTVARFLHRTLSQPGWAAEGIKNIISGASGLRDDKGQDVFDDRFEYLRKSVPNDVSVIYADILRRVMHTDSSGSLRLCLLRGQSGELGLKAAGSDDYFGVIYIGDTAAFRNLVDQEESGIIIEEDSISGSLFDRINERGKDAPPVQILIGAKKFMEGWNSWRVSNMGLLNIGRSEGPQIIQLFGRGVRLRGQDMSLKRNTATKGPHPDCIGLLETLNIFAVRADYMAQFREYLAGEGVDTAEPLQLSVPVRTNQDFLNQELLIPRLPAGQQFAGATVIMMEPLNGMRPVTIDMSTAVQQIISEGNSDVANYASGAEQVIPPESMDLVDWDATYVALLSHKDHKQYDNLVVWQEGLRRIIKAGVSAYRLISDTEVVTPHRPTDRERLQEAVESILRRYADAIYRHHHHQWESNNLAYQRLDSEDANLRFNISDDNQQSHYIIRASRQNTQLIAEIEHLIADCNALYRHDQDNLPRIHFDQHLYQPLLLKNDDIENISPPGLEKSEREFVADLREFWAKRRHELPDDTELFLLRNLSTGKGVGFFESAYFYPDFILWIKNGKTQRIVFVEPHGMRHAPAYDSDAKAQLHLRLKELETAIAERTKPDTTNVHLDSYIISATSYHELRHHYGNGDWSVADFADKNILFPENHNHIAAILLSPEPKGTTPPC